MLPREKKNGRSMILLSGSYSGVVIIIIFLLVLTERTGSEIAFPLAGVSQFWTDDEKEICFSKRTPQRRKISTQPQEKNKCVAVAGQAEMATVEVEGERKGP